MISDYSTSGLIPISGSNFSGRSFFLDALTNNQQSEKSGIYLGEIPSDYISGFVPTVNGEIELHSSTSTKKTLSAVNELLAYYDFEKHALKNPFWLSGGEKTILVLLSHLLLQPAILSIDTLIEQLNKKWRDPLLKAIKDKKFPQTTVYMADNRLDEYGLTGVSIDDISDARQPEHKYAFNSPVIMNDIPSISNPKKIRLRDITFGYNKNTTVLKKINANLEPGTIYHLQGKNGAGKSTLAKILTGLLELQSGEIFVNDRKYDSYRYPGSLTGYSFQSPDEQLFSKRVKDELFISNNNEEVYSRKRREAFIKMFGLQQIMSCHPAELPYVMRKRISLAATLAMDRPWYILDEPTLGQDDYFTDFLVHLLNTFTEEGKGIIIISHSESFIKKFNNTPIRLEKGILNKP